MNFFLYGQDTYLSRQKLQELKKRFLAKQDQHGFSLLELDGRDLTIDFFRRAVLSGGLFTEKRMVVVESLFKQKKDTNFFKEVSNIIKQNQDDKNNILIFWDEEIDEKKLSAEQKEIFKLLNREKYKYYFPVFKKEETIKWLQKEAVRRGGKIELAAASLLVENIGLESWQLSNELDRLLATTKNSITVEAVGQSIYQKPEENIWFLMDAISEKNRKRALSLLADQIELEPDLGNLIGLLARQVRILLQVKEALGASKLVNQFVLAKKLEIHPFSCQKAMAQTKNYTLEELKKIHNQLLEIDLKRKTTRLDPEVLLDLLIIG